jgi:predicted Ser/Thr protein kinase
MTCDSTICWKSPCAASLFAGDAEVSAGISTAPAPADTCVRSASLTDEAPTLPLHGLPEPRAAGSAPPLSLAAGAVLCSRYLLEEEIGRGGISFVFRARDLQQPSADGAATAVAIKVLRPELRGNRWALACLQREFRQMQRLSHPAIARVFDLGCDGDVWFISMELVVGQTVRSWNGTPGGDPAIAMRIIEGCCAAIEHAHSLGILHGDLKPTNVIVTRHGTAILIDFGSMPEPGSRIPAGELHALAATPLYASPQVLMGREGEGRDDVFSLACLSYSILSGGGHPFGGRPSYEDGRVKSAPTYARRIAAGLFKVIERGLAGDRERRQESVREFRLEMTAASRSVQADATTVCSAERPQAGERIAALLEGADKIEVGRRTSWRTPLWAPLTAVGMALVAIALVFRYGTHGALRDADALPMPPASHVAPEVPETGAQPPPVAATSPRLRNINNKGIVSFASATIHATAAQPLIAIAVRRLGRTGSRGAFKWRVAKRSADAEFDHVGAQAGLVRFNEGQAVRILYIPLANVPGTPLRGRRDFTVTLERVAGGSALGSPASVTVAFDPPASDSQLALNYPRASK